MTETNNTWVAYGDVNPLEHGGVWTRQDDDFINCFKVVTVDLIQDQNHDDFSAYEYQLTETYIDITDTWINWEGVNDCMGEDIEDRKAQNVVSYYGAYHSNGTIEVITGEKNVINWLYDRGIEVK